MKKLLQKWIAAAKGNLSLRIKLDPNHQMVILFKALDWRYLIQISEEQRQKNVKNGAGRKPHLRILMGVVIVHILESCTLRKAQDLVQHYAPARLLCCLRWSLWTPNFRTISDFEIMLGSDGLARINAYVLKVAQSLGFADIKGLCSDTTAQEAEIPYPNEVGLMNSFAKSVQAAIAQLKGKISATAKRGLLRIIGEMKKLVRHHRLFAKTKEAKKEIEQKLINLTKRLSQKLSGVIPTIRGSLRGHQKNALRRLLQLQDAFGKLAPQIDYYIKNRKVAKGKIISLFQPLLRSIVRGKSGKDVEFGIKWGINRIRGGYLWLFLMPGNAKGEGDYMVQSVKEHIALFGQAPNEYGYDRGGWSDPHMKVVDQLGVKRIAVAPKGKASWKVSDLCKDRMVRERAQVEGVIGTLKHIGLNKPHSKTTPGMIRAGHRAGVRFNLSKVIRDVRATTEGKRAA